MSKILIDDEGENRAVRAFLAIYGGVATVTVENMRRRLKAAGFDGAWPNWANNHAGHLTKAGAQIWIRHLLKLEQLAQKEPETKDVVINNMGKPFTVRAYVTPQAQPAPAAQPSPVQKPVAYLHQCGKKPELRELSFNKHEPLLAAKGYKATPLTTPQAQPAPAAPVQEPCGWQFFQDGKWHNGMETSDHRKHTEAAGVPVRDVYPSPPAQQEPLTDEQMAKAWAVADGEHNASASVKRRITRAIEAAHNIKENQS